MEYPLVKGPLNILFTGGGTAGHVIPHIALIEQFYEMHPTANLAYIGSQEGIEKRLVKDYDVTYYSITTGKWCRYWSWRNFLVPYQVIKGLLQTIYICYRFRPSILFSKGGFVALPVVIGCFLCRIPVIVHESDVIPGLANRLSFPFAKLICYTFQIEPLIDYPHKRLFTGLPVRKSLSHGVAQQGRKCLNFHATQPIVLIWGGSLGAVTINDSIYRLLPTLLKNFQVIHICGVDKMPAIPPIHSQYRLFEYVDTALLSHLLACADIVISRAGATAIYELLVLHKPHILCPLSLKASRGEQIKNAQYCEKLGVSKVIYPESFNDQSLWTALQMVYRKRKEWQLKIAHLNFQSGTRAVYKALLNCAAQTKN